MAGAVSVVQVRIAAVALGYALRLPGTAVITGIGAVPESTPLPAAEVTLMVDVPDAPPGAVYAVPQYSKLTGVPDPVIFEQFSWYAADDTPLTGPAA